MPTYFDLSTGNLTQDWSNTGLLTTNDSWPANLSIIGWLGDNTGAGTSGATNPQDVTGSSASVDLIANQSATTITNGGVAEFQITNPVVALQGSGTARSPYLAFYVDATGRQDIHVSYNVRDIDANDDTTQRVALQYRTDPNGAWINVPDGYIADATAGPGQTQPVTAVSVTLPALANNAGTLEIRVITTDAPGSDEWVGIDDIVVSSSPASASPGIFTVADASVSEGDSGTTPISFTVTRAGGSAGASDVAYHVTLPGGVGGADAGDFVGGAPADGVVHFADGETSKVITLDIAGDTVYESNETFSVALTSASAGSLGAHATATGTIQNDDPAPAGSLGLAGNVIHAEGDSGSTDFTFTVNRAGGSVGAVSADYAVGFGTANAADFTGDLSGTVSFADGETSKTITVHVAGDTTYEGDDTFTVSLSNAQGGAGITAGQGSATGTITNDDAAPPPPPVFINEIHYDNDGTDVGEAIELAGPAGTSLTGWSLVLYNGNGGASYDTIALSGTIDDESNGYGAVSFARAGIQNGDPDAIALVAPGGQVVQFLSYGGSFVATNGPAAGQTSVDIGVKEGSSVPIGYSLQLAGNGAVADDYHWQSASQSSFGSLNAGETFYAATDAGHFRIGDASVTEGDSGTHALTFVITRSGGSAGAATVDYALDLSGSASAADLAPGTQSSGTISFGVGEISKSIVVNVVGDTLPEPNETFSVDLSNATGNSVLTDDTGTGTIVNDDPLPLAIYDIQGAGLTSAYVGQKVTTTGIVTAVGTSGFYIQDATGDGNSTTSDAIFVATSSKAAVAVGDSVSVAGLIAEAGSNGELTVTQFQTGATVTVGTHGNALPTAILIGEHGLHAPTEIIDNDHLQSFDPATDGIDFYETMEGMRVTIETPQVVARTEGGETWAVASNGVGATGMTAAGGISISAGDYNPEKILLKASSDVFNGFTGNFTQGDQLSSVTGVLGYDSSSNNGATYNVTVTEAATLTHDANLQPETTNLVGDANHLTIASFNMENADVSDGQQKFDLLAQTVVYNLRAPDIIFAQEIQDADGAGLGSDLTGTVTANAVIAAIDALGGPHYTYVEVAPSVAGQNGGETGGNIRNGYFYNADRVDYVDGSAHLITGPAYDDSRKPLVADFTFNGQTITAIDVHSTSRLGSDALFGSYQPPLDGGDAARTAQAAGIKAYVDALLQADPTHNIVVGGDFNGFYFEDALHTLGSNGLTNLNSLIPVEERYSYLFEGNLQQIDNILASDNLMNGAQFDAVHINTLKATGVPEATDHDQVITSLYVPFANHAPVGVGDAVGVNEDATSTNLYASLLVNDTDQDAGQILTIVGVDTTNTIGHVLFDAATHSLSYVADADAFDALANGVTAIDHFTYTLSDGTTTTTATVDVTVTGIADSVTQNGGSANDTINGSAADDRIYGNAGNDTLNGGAGTDGLSGGLGNDTLNGQDGNDFLLGGLGNDALNGGAGDDYLSGDTGNDTLAGGLGHDTFVFGSAGGKDIIADFDVTADRILLGNNLSLLSSTVGDFNGDHVQDITLQFSGGTQAVLYGVSDPSLIHIDKMVDPLMNDFLF